MSAPSKDTIDAWTRFEVANTNYVYRDGVAINMRAAAESGAVSSRDLQDAEHQLNLAKIELVAASATVDHLNPEFLALDKALKAFK